MKLNVLRRQILVEKQNSCEQANVCKMVFWPAPGDVKDGAFGSSGVSASRTFISASAVSHFQEEAVWLHNLRGNIKCGLCIASLSYCTMMRLHKKKKTKKKAFDATLQNKVKFSA